MDRDSVSAAELQSFPFFSDFLPAHLETIAKISQIRELPEKKHLFHEGDAKDFIYLVLEGRVALEIHLPQRGRLRILTVEPQDVVGWSSMANSIARRTASAIAVTPTRLLAIDAAKLDKACKEDCGLGFTIMTVVANVIANRLMVTRMQLLDMFANPSAEGYHA